MQRQKPEFRQREKERNKLARRRARLDPLYRAREMQRDRFWRKQMRMNPEYRARERVRDMLAKQRLRQDPIYRARERLLQEARRKSKIYKIGEKCSKIDFQIISDNFKLLGHTRIALLKNNAHIILMGVR